MSFACNCCGKQAHDNTRVLALARRSCVHGGHWQTSRGTHDLHSRGDHWECRRCGHRSDNAHAGAAKRAQCPVPAFFAASGHSTGAEAWYRGVLGWMGLWRRAGETEEDPLAHHGEPPLAPGPARQGVKRARVEPAVPHAQASRPATRAFLPAYADHRMLDAAGCTFCLRCGDTARDDRRIPEMAGQPCKSQAPAVDLSVGVKVALGELGPEAATPKGRPLSEPERGRLAELSALGRRLACGPAKWPRLHGRGGESLI